MNKKLLILAPALLLTIVSCGGNKPASTNSVSSNTPTTSDTPTSVVPPHKAELRLSVHYQDEKTRMTVGTTNAEYKDPAGNTYKTGDFKPAWKAIQQRLDFTIKDVTPAEAKKVADSYAAWQSKQFKGVDIVCGSAASIVSDSVIGDNFVNLLDHLDKMPNFKAFLEKNPIVEATITSAKYGDNLKDAIYYAPYFDGYDDLERMTLLREDWVEKLLDSNDATFDTATEITSVYQAQSGTTTRNVEVPKADGSGKETVQKKVAKNIVSIQNSLATKNGATLVQALRDYIDEAYGTQYTKRSELFTSARAAYDADEFIALLRCVKANPQLLSGTDNVTPFFPRASTNDRISDIYRWAGNLWGIRGLDSRSGFLYVNKNNELKDSRGDDATAKMLSNLNAIYQEGLILKDFDKTSASAGGKGDFVGDLLKKGTAFASYDYCQTQTAHNGTVDKTQANLASFRYLPVIGAVNDYDDGKTGNYIHFTESWRSVKTEGWAITTDVLADEVNFNKALELFDYFYSDAGNELMSYGPKEYGYLAMDGDKVKTIEYNGMKVPQLSDGTLTQFADKKMGNKNYTNYYRYFVGSTYPVGYVKQQGMEYQCTVQEGKDGLKKFEALINQGLLIHPTVDNIAKENRNGFYDLVPTTFRISSGDATKLSSEFTNLDTINYTKGKTNEWSKYVIAGFGGTFGDQALVASEDKWKEQMVAWKVGEFQQIYANALKTMLGE